MKQITQFFLEGESPTLSTLRQQSTGGVQYRHVTDLTLKSEKDNNSIKTGKCMELKRLRLPRNLSIIGQWNTET